MKAVIAVIVAVVVGSCAWLVVDADRARLQTWAEQWTAGAINHVDHYLQHNAELRMRIDRMKAEEDDLHHYVATLEDNLAYQMQAGRREEREAADLRLQLTDMVTERDAALAREPGVIVVHIPVLAHHHHAHRTHRHHRHHHRVHCDTNRARRTRAENAD